MTNDQLLRKVSLRLLPFAIICYLFNYIDRINISIAKLPMSRDPALGDFNDHVFAVGAALFFLGYFVFEIPSNLLQQKVGARRWIARIMISWGLVSACFLFTAGPKSFYALRLLLGLAEAGFFPGMILYLSYWIPQHHRARASAIFLTSTAIAGLIGNPLGGAILYFSQQLPWLKPWQYLFLVEGIPTIILGFVALLVLRDSPQDAHWLTAEEKTQLQALLAHEHRTHAAPHLSTIAHAFASPKVWLLSLLYSLQIFGFYAINYWTPTLIKKTLTDTGTLTAATPPYVADLYTSLLSAIPFGAATLGMILIGRSSDRHRERRFHLAFACALATIGLSLAGLAPSLAPPNSATFLTIAGLSIGAVGAFGAFGPFWSLPSTILTGTAAATAIALINSIGNLFGGFLGPPIIQQLSLKYGLLLAGGLAACGVLLILLMPLPVSGTRALQVHAEA
jgi:MFS family permease